MKCLIYGHRPIEMAATPDRERCRQANVPMVQPGHPVVVCAECGSELYAGPMDGYLYQVDRPEPATIQ